jgi:streptogramin lyase
LTTFRSPRGGLLVHAFGSIWISDADSHVVARVDLDARRIVAEIAWPGPDGAGPYPVHLVEGDGALWVVDEGALAVFRIDPDRNAAERVDIDLAFIDGTSFGDHPIAFGEGELWVRESEATLARIDTATLTVAERISTEEYGGGDFVATGDAFWYASMKGDELVGLQRP